MTLDPGRVRVRPRRSEDIPALAEVLLGQQSKTRYPFREPLLVPVERFLHADDAEAAWTAEVDGRPLGHVCRTRPRHGFSGAREMNDACAAAHGCAADRLAWVSTLFVGPEARGLGVGRLLLRTVVDDIHGAGLRACLEVLPVHAAALSLYESTGWREVARLRPGWLEGAVGADGLEVHVLVHGAALPHPDSAT